MKTNDSKKTVIVRPSTSLIARKASGRLIVQTGLRAGAAAKEASRKST